MLVHISPQGDYGPPAPCQLEAGVRARVCARPASEGKQAAVGPQAVLPAVPHRAAQGHFQHQIFQSPLILHIRFFVRY